MSEVVVRVRVRIRLGTVILSAENPLSNRNRLQSLPGNIRLLAMAPYCRSRDAPCHHVLGPPSPNA